MNCNNITARIGGRRSDTTELYDIAREFISADIDGASLCIAAAVRIGEKAPILALHGFGSTKEDYADLLHNPLFADHAIVLYDAPGCGESACDNLSALSISALCAAAQRVIEHFELKRFHLIGHSMGGLTALLLAREAPDRLLSFTNIEGNLAPEDCFLSRQIETYPSDDPAIFFNEFAERTWRRKSSSNQLYAVGLKHKVRPAAVAPIFRSMVEISDQEDLLHDYISLRCPKLFVYGDENLELSYLETLAHGGVQLAEIAHSGHFPMYSNPPALWQRIAAFIQQAESVNHDES